MSKKVNSDREYSITILTKVCSDGDVSVANVDLSIISTVPVHGNQGYIDESKCLYGISSTGRATRAKGDTPNAELGEQIALARALQNVTRKYVESMEGLIKHKDDIQAQRKIQVASKAGKMKAWLKRQEEEKIARAEVRLKTQLEKEVAREKEATETEKT